MARMTKKSVLDTTSRKKRNGMISYSNTNTDGTGRQTTGGPAYVNGNSNGLFLWCPTATDLNNAAGGANIIINENERTATVCYMRGLSENLRIEANTGLAWHHRRICFKSRSNLFRGLAPASAAQQPNPFGFVSPYVEVNPGGNQRFWFNASISGIDPTVNNWLIILFKGQQGVDWDNYITAPVDTRRVDLCYDKKRVYRSGNAQGFARDFSLWHGMNKNLVYDDDENGDGMSSAAFSVTDKQGMGDYYVLDIVQPAFGGTTSDIIRINANSTLYWHEK